MTLGFGLIGPDGSVREESGHPRLITPVHLLVAAADDDGPAGVFVRERATQPLARAAGVVETGGSPTGTSSDIYAGQVWSSAQRLAADLGQELVPEHVLVVLLEQGRPEVIATLEAAGVDPSELRRTALSALGADTGLTPRLEPLPPAGMAGVPPVPLEDLPDDVWSELRGRQLSLRLGRIKNKAQWYAVLANEERTVQRLLATRDLSADEQQSFLVHHRSAVEALLGEAVPSLRARIAEDRQPSMDRRLRRRRWRRHRRLMGALDMLSGWGVWFGNRRSGWLRRWYRLTMPK